MSPGLRADQIPVGNFPRDRAETVHDGEVRVTCDRDDCEWSTIRPEQHTWSASEAHRIEHAKGMR